MTDYWHAVREAGTRLRTDVRAATGRMLAAFGDRQARAREPFDAKQIRQVLIVRMNGRMGNTLFLTPLLTAIHDALPEAAIDVLTGYREAGDLLRGIPGVRKVMILPHKRWWRFRHTLKWLRDFRAQHYDLAIDPVPNSSGGRMALTLVHTRWRLGFAGHDQWLRLDCAVDQPRDVPHEALRPLALVAPAFGIEPAPSAACLRIANSPSELEAGAALMAKSLGLAARRPAAGSPVIGFFASARDQKDLGAEWWRQFWQAYLALAPDTAPLEVLPTERHRPISADFATVHCPLPRQLAATIAKADWFFSADTGPMHLASAAGVPTIAFFESTDPAVYGPIKPNDVVLRINDMTAQDVARNCARLVAGARSDAGSTNPAGPSGPRNLAGNPVSPDALYQGTG